MKKWKLSTKAKQTLSIAFLVLSIAFFVLLFAFKSRLTDCASQLVRAQTDSGIQNIESIKVDSAFNYKKNGLPYEVTFLEFGATGCSACKRMEIVMSDIRKKYPQKVNVVFLNVLLPQNQNLMKYFGIASIPTQVLLNKEGKEFFRHNGYLSTMEISEIIQQN
jgi:thioredoxin 1